jgi:hypothetical protein
VAALGQPPGQEELAKKMEALAEEPDLEVAARRMRELQGRWKQVALAPRTQGEALWRRFKTAQDAVFGRTSAHLAAQNEERVQNLAKKQSLCEQAEALAASTDWVKTATALQHLQASGKPWERCRGAARRQSGSASARPAISSSAAATRT